MISSATRRNISPALASRGMLAAGFRTRAIQKNDPSQIESLPDDKTAERRMIGHVRSPENLVHSSVKIQDAATALGLMKEASIPNFPLVNIDGQDYRVMVRGERYLNKIQDSNIKEGICELSQDTSVTSSFDVAGSFSNLVPFSTMQALQDLNFLSASDVREHVSDATSKMALVFIPVGMKLPQISQDFSRQFNLPPEDESVLPNGTLVEMREAPPKDVATDSLPLPKAIRQRCERGDLELFYVRCLNKAEAIAAREKAREA